MHKDEIDISADLVRGLLADQFPQWAGLRIDRLPSPGTENAIFRLGDELLVRMPRIHWAADAPKLEYRWLPEVASRLPVEWPRPVALGQPGSGYPFDWLIVEWIPGHNAYDAPPADTRQLAVDLAGYVKALHSVPVPDPAPGAGRGVPLSAIDGWVREGLGLLAGDPDGVDLAAAAATWEWLRSAPAWSGAPVWIHGDLTRTNLIVEHGRLKAVIDYAGLGVGDPAADMIPAWTVLDGDDRRLFRELVGVDDDTWTRGQGWALAPALIALPYYRHTNPVIVDYSRDAIAAVLA